MTLSAFLIGGWAPERFGHDQKPGTPHPDIPVFEIHSSKGLRWVRAAMCPEWALHSIETDDALIRTSLEVKSLT